MRLPSLNVQILAAAVFGALAGAYLNHQGSDSPEQQSLLPVLQLTGGLFVDLLKMVLIPLVFTSVASGVASLGGHEHSGRIWRSTLIYYLGTTALAAVLGLILMNVFEPGKGLQINLFLSGDEQHEPARQPDSAGISAHVFTQYFRQPSQGHGGGRRPADGHFRLAAGAVDCPAGRRGRRAS
jgi:Na+/H+-dicarboxylate symporter